MLTRNKTLFLSAGRFQQCDFYAKFSRVFGISVLAVRFFSGFLSQGAQAG
jgi:hypothetical protein